MHAQLPPHVVKRMEDWEFNEVELRDMLERGLTFGTGGAAPARHMGGRGEACERIVAGRAAGGCGTSGRLRRAESS